MSHDIRSFKPNPVVGTPAADQYFMDGTQGPSGPSDIKCQEYIIQMFTGTDVDHTQLLNDAMTYGGYAPDAGTAIDDLGNLLELYGVPVNRFEQSNVFHLANELAQGHKVMIPIDGGELRNGPTLLDAILEALGLDSGADHTVIVSGIDATDPNAPMVIVSDPSTGETAARYPLEQFLEAWQDSDFSMVATQQPAPHSAPGMEYFPYEMGHLPTVLDMPYEQFLAADAIAWGEQYFRDPSVGWVQDPALLGGWNGDHVDPVYSGETPYPSASSCTSSTVWPSFHEDNGYLDSNSAFDEYNEWAADYYTDLGNSASSSAEYALHCGDVASFEYYSGQAASDYGDADFYSSYTVDTYHSAGDEVCYDSYEDYKLESYDDVPY